MVDSRSKRFLRAAGNGQERTVQQYLRDGVNPNIQDEYGVTALHKAAIRGSLALLKILLSRKNIDVNKTNGNYETALILAARNGNYFVVNNLLRHGADINHVDRDGCNALDYAKQHDRRDIARILREAGARSTGNRGRAGVSVLRQVLHEDTAKTMLLRLVQDPKARITARQLRNVTHESRISSLPLFVYANYLLHFLKRAGHPAMDWFSDFDGSEDYLLGNVYYQASRLRLGKEGQFLVGAAAKYAQARGLIRKGSAVNVVQFVRVVAHNLKEKCKLQLVVEEVLKGFRGLDMRITNAERMSSEALAKLNQLADNDRKIVEDTMRMRDYLNELHLALRRKERVDKIAGVFRFLLSTVPVFGSALGNLAYSSAEIFFGLTSESLVGIGTDLVKGGVSLGLGVDLSDSTSVGVVTSRRLLSKLTPKCRKRIEFAVRESKFEGLENISEDLRYADN